MTPLGLAKEGVIETQDMNDRFVYIALTFHVQRVYKLQIIFWGKTVTVAGVTTHCPCKRCGL